jgi:hypothetical protein
LHRIIDWADACEYPNHFFRVPDNRGSAAEWQANDLEGFIQWKLGCIRDRKQRLQQETEQHQHDQQAKEAADREYWRRVAALMSRVPGFPHDADADGSIAWLCVFIEKNHPTWTRQEINLRITDRAWLEAFLQQSNAEIVEIDATQHDTKDDTGKKHQKKVRPQTRDLIDCSKDFKREVAKDPTIKKTQFIRDWAEEKKKSKFYLLRVSNDHPSLFKKR